VQAFPDAARALSDVGIRGATVMHLEVPVGAVAKELRAARAEVGQPGEELLGGLRWSLAKVDRGHGCSLREGCSFGARASIRPWYRSIPLSHGSGLRPFCQIRTDKDADITVDLAGRSASPSKWQQRAEQPSHLSGLPVPA